jgi:hypothetical protein
LHAKKWRATALEIAEKQYLVGNNHVHGLRAIVMTITDVVAVRRNTSPGNGVHIPQWRWSVA